MATTSTRVSEETKLRQEVAKAKREYEKIKQRNRNFNVNLDDEEAAALEVYENAQSNLETYQSERQERLTQKGKENKIETLQTRILAEQTRLDGLKAPDRGEGFLVPAATENRVRKLEESIYKKEQEVLRLGGELRTPTKFDLFKPETQASASTTTSTQTPLITDRAQSAEERRMTTQAGATARVNVLLPQGSVVERKSNGTFSVNGIDSIFVYDKTNNQLAPQNLESFFNGLYTLTPDAITQYKKGLGYKAEDINGVLTDKFRQDMFDSAKAVSEYNYGYSLSGLKRPVDLIQYLSNSEVYPEIQSIVGQQKSGGEGGGVKIDAAKLAANVDTIKLLETQLGVSLNKKQRDQIARDLATGRVNATTLQSTVARAGNILLEEGEAAATRAALKELAAANGVDMGLGEAWFDNATKRILEGKTTIDTINNEILNQAKMKYGAPSIVAGLDAGFSIRDQFSQHANWLAQVRGVDPKSISLEDPILQKAFMNRNNEGMPVQMDMYDWQNWAKENDPAYATSSMAEESYMSALRAMGKAFGKSI